MNIPQISPVLKSVSQVAISIQNIQVCNSIPISYLCRQIQVVTIIYVKNENLYETDGGADRRP